MDWEGSGLDWDHNFFLHNLTFSIYVPIFVTTGQVVIEIWPIMCIFIWFLVTMVAYFLLSYNFFQNLTISTSV